GHGRDRDDGRGPSHVAGPRAHVRGHHARARARDIELLPQPTVLLVVAPARPHPAHTDRRNDLRRERDALLRTDPRDARVDARRGTRAAKYTHGPRAHWNPRERARG